MAFALSFLQLLLGIALLFAGGELFVAGSVALSLLFGIPQIVIGLTVVSFGTSAPELFVSLLSTLQTGGSTESIAVSNVVGSNIFNLLVVLGASALVMPLRVQSRLIRRDVPLLLAISMAAWGMASSGTLTWVAGLALLTVLLINLIWEVRTAREEGAGDEPLEDDAAAPLPVALGKGFLGLVLLVVGSQVLVNGATGAALALGVSQTVIGLTIISAGTGMPELVTSLVSVYRGRTDLAIGNVVGSNLMNLLLILGGCALATGGSGLAVDPVLISRDFPLMVAATLACLPIFWSGGVINRLEGAVLVVLYALYLVEQVLSNTMPLGDEDPFRLVVLVVVLPAVLVFIAWSTLSWQRSRRA
jgi:cation:H+ antiporter